MLALIAQAKTDREIAAELGLAHETVRGYVKAIFKKLGVHKRIAAAYFLAQTNGSDTSN